VEHVPLVVTKSIQRMTHRLRSGTHAEESGYNEQLVLELTRLMCEQPALFLQVQ